MTDPTDDDLDDGALERAGGGGSGEGKKKGATDSGEGDADSFGRGKAGTAAGIARLSPKKLKEVMANWRELTAQELVDAVVEFFAEGPMRASANAIVSWVQNANAKSFAIVNWVITAGDKAVTDVRKLQRAVGRAGGGGARIKQPKSPINKFGLNPGMNGPTGGPTGS